MGPSTPTWAPRNRSYDGIALRTVVAVPAATRRFLAEPTTWTGVVVVLLKSLYGVAAFVVTVTRSALVVTMLAALLVYDDPQVGHRIGRYAVSTPPEALAVAGVGVRIVCNVCNALAAAGGVMTDALLSVGRETDP